jgi:sugar/nucleoside kinase (ribokinase family)
VASRESVDQPQQQRQTTWEVQVAGHICVDLIPSLAGLPDVTPGRLIDVGRLAMRLGGCVGNTGLDLAALGIRCGLVSSVGDDLLSRTVIALVAGQQAVDQRIEVASGQTTSYSIVIQPPEVDRTFWHHAGSNAAFDGSLIDVGAAPLLHVGYLPLLPSLTQADGSRLRDLLHKAHATAVTTSIDMCVVDPRLPPVNWTRLLTGILPLCDVISPSADDMRSALNIPDLAAKEAAEWLVRRGAAIAMVSDGPQDIYVATAGAERFAATAGRVSTLLAELPTSWYDRAISLSPLKVPAVDTTGAGDAATAGLLAGIVRGLDLNNTLELVLAAAAHRVAGKGSLSTLTTESLPRRLSH